MERVGLRTRPLISRAVGARHDQQTLVGHDPGDLFENLVLLSNVFDHFKRDDNVEAVIREGRQVGCRSNLETQHPTLVVEDRVLNRILGDIDSDYRRCPVGKNRRAEALAAAEIQYTLTFDQRLSPKVTVEMLVNDGDVGCPRHTTLSGPIN